MTEAELKDALWTAVRAAAAYAAPAPVPEPTPTPTPDPTPVPDPTPTPTPEPTTPSPTVWLTPERLTRLKGYAVVANTTRWQMVKAFADRGLSDTGHDFWLGIDMALAYQVTGNAAYSNKVADLLVYLCTPDRLLTGDSYLEMEYLLNYAQMYSWCRDAMTPEARAQVSGWMLDRADSVWPETNPARAGAWGVDNPANNYFYKFLCTWCAGLACLADDPARAQKHVDLAKSKYTTRVVPFFDGWGKGGVFAEGTNYDSGWLMAAIVDAHKSVTGENLWHPWFAEAVAWQIASTTPDLAYRYPHGDQARESSGSLFDYDRRRMLICAEVGMLAAEGKGWLDAVAVEPCRQPYTAFYEFLYYREEIPAVPLTLTPYLAEGPGIYIHHAAGIMWGVFCGRLWESHQANDALGFRIWRNGWQTCDANIYSHSGIVQNTDNFNAPTLALPLMDRYYQPGMQEKGGTGTLKLTETADAVIVEMDATDCYVWDRSHGGEALAKEVKRTLFFIKALEAFVIRDRVVPRDAGVARRFNLQHHEPVLSFDAQFSVPGTMTVIPRKYDANNTGVTSYTHQYEFAVDDLTTVLQFGTPLVPVFAPDSVTVGNWRIAYSPASVTPI